MECLLRPNFYGGQLLTDRDLKSLVDWVQEKSALKRYREGWGVVCGLEVTCGQKAKEESRVYVSEGYAVDCCGRDVVVCEPIWYDFTCEKSFDPCCRERKGEQSEQQGNAEPAPVLGCIPLSELRAFDLCLSFDEQMTGGQRALTKGSCTPRGECQFTRIREKGKLTTREIKDPCTVRSEKPDQAYRRQLQELLGQLQQHRDSPQRLLEYIRGTLHSFCFVEDCLCKVIRERKEGEPWNDQNWIFYIVQDFRNHYFQCLCDACKHNPCEGDGVPLARVWLWDKKQDDRRICKVVYIDQYPPYRRVLQEDCWPSHPGHVNLSPYVWRELGEVSHELKRSGFTIVEEERAEFNPDSIWGWGSSEATDLIFAPYASRLVIRWYPDLCGQRRVVAFERRLD
jgi:hypothetical protein